MANSDDKAGCGCIFIIVLIIGCIVSYINGCRDEKRSANLKPDYSSHASEEGQFSGYGGMIGASGFEVRDGVGYLKLYNGHVLKMWRNRYGEYEGRYDGLTYTATKTSDGYMVRRKR